MRRSVRIGTAMLMAMAFPWPALAHGDHRGFDELLIGKAGNPEQVIRTIDIDMTDDLRFTPASIMVAKDQTIRLVITNRGRRSHELMLGTPRRLREHHEFVKSNPGMRMSTPYRIALAPGTSGDIVWQFSHSGKIGFACFEPGHFDAGMQGEIVVTALVGNEAPSDNGR